MSPIVESFGDCVKRNLLMDNSLSKSAIPQLLQISLHVSDVTCRDTLWRRFLLPNLFEVRQMAWCRMRHSTERNSAVQISHRQRFQEVKGIQTRPAAISCSAVLTSVVVAPGTPIFRSVNRGSTSQRKVHRLVQDCRFGKILGFF